MKVYIDYDHSIVRDLYTIWPDSVYSPATKELFFFNPLEDKCSIRMRWNVTQCRVIVMIGDVAILSRYYHYKSMGMVFFWTPNQASKYQFLKWCSREKNIATPYAWVEYLQSHLYVGGAVKSPLTYSFCGLMLEDVQVIATSHVRHWTIYFYLFIVCVCFLFFSFSFLRGEVGCTWIER